jgi:hypothetical protein
LAACTGISLANVSPWIVQARLISPFHLVFGRLHKKVGCIIGVCLMVFGRLHMLSGLTTFPAQVFSPPPSSSPPSSSSLTHHGRDDATSMEGSTGAARCGGGELGRVATQWSCGGGAPAQRGGGGLGRDVVEGKREPQLRVEGELDRTRCRASTSRPPTPPPPRSRDPTAIP